MQVTVDAGEWRSGSDLVLAYWLDRLAPDPESHVMSADRYADFTEWPEARGQRAWADRTFVERFEEHDQTPCGRDRQESGERTPQWALATVPGLPTTVEGRSTAWLGVRFRTPAPVAPGASWIWLACDCWSCL